VGRAGSEAQRRPFLDDDGRVCEAQRTRTSLTRKGAGRERGKWVSRGIWNKSGGGKGRKPVEKLTCDALWHRTRMRCQSRAAAAVELLQFQAYLLAAAAVEATYGMAKRTSRN
jgi:hypothetical protein